MVTAAPFDLRFDSRLGIGWQLSSITQQGTLFRYGVERGGKATLTQRPNHQNSFRPNLGMAMLIKSNYWSPPLDIGVSGQRDQIGRFAANWNTFENR